MSSKSRILLFSYDAGGANEVMAYGYLMDKKSYKVLAFPQGPAVNIFKQHIPNLISDNLPDFQKGDIVITGTSGIHSNYELEITRKAKKFNIEVITLLDSTDELLTRFSFDGSTLASDEYLPNTIITAEKFFSSEVMELNPKLSYHESYYLYYLKNFFYKNSIPITNPIIKEYQGEYILLVTEYFQELFGDRYGFNEFDLCKNLFQAVQEINPSIPILLKTHPAEKDDKFDQLIKRYDLNIKRDKFIIQEAVKYSKCVFGINSSVFKDSTLIEKPTYSIQIGSKEQVNTILPRENVLLTQNELKDTLQNLFI